MRVGQVVLPQQVFAVVVAVGRANDDVYMLARGLLRVRGETGQIGWPLMIELDQDHRAVNAVVENAVAARSHSAATGSEPAK